MKLAVQSNALRSKVLELYRLRLLVISMIIHDSDAISASRKRPGMIYVNDRKPLSIEPIEEAFDTIKSSYNLPYVFGISTMLLATFLHAS